MITMIFILLMRNQKQREVKYITQVTQATKDQCFSSQALCYTTCCVSPVLEEKSILNPQQNIILYMITLTKIKSSVDGWRRPIL